MPNPLGQVIPKSNGRRFVITDIHGCYQTLLSLISKIGLSDSDMLLLLGDYVSKGPACKATLDYIIELANKPNVFPLLGNHDKMVLDYLNDPDLAGEAKLRDSNNDDFLKLSSEEQNTYRDFLTGLPYYFVCGDFILVHAGLNFNLANPFLGKEDMLNIREFYYDSAKAQNKTIVHGHVPHEKSIIEEQVKNRSKIIPLDNGCVYADEREGMGELLCLNMESMEISSQQYCG